MIRDLHMKNNMDARWQQRLQNYTKALTQLINAVALAKQRKLSLLEQQGLVQAFEFTHELAWKVMKDYAYYQGNASITGSRDATRESFSIGIIDNADVWMEMINSRNHASHTYNQQLVEEICDYIINKYSTCFINFLTKMESLKNE